MNWRHPRSTSTDTRLPYTTLVRSPRRHVQQVAQRERTARIASALPRIDRRRTVERQLPVGDEEAGEHRGNALRHRPADQLGSGSETRAIAFIDQLADRKSTRLNSSH